MTARGWRRLRQAVQVIAFLAFVALLVRASAQRPVRLWADLSSRLDPLVMIASSLAGHTLLAGLALAGPLLLLTLVLGRGWCGWLCPLGSLLDWLSPRRARPAPPAEQWRAAKVLIALAVLAGAVLGSQVLTFLDPITLLNRTAATAFGPALRHLVYGAEALLYSIEPLWGPLDALHRAIVAPLFAPAQPVFALAPWTGLFLIGLVALNWWAPRFWCRYLCPLGGLLAIVSRWSLLRREAGPGCSGCGKCGRACPVGTIDPDRGYRSDPAECVECLDCLVDCRPGASAFRFRAPESRRGARYGTDPTRRQVLLTAAAMGAGVALAAVEPVALREPAHFIRPPGADPQQFAAKCARCGACLRACPTQGLQPSLLGAGLQNLMAPHLVPRLGFCDFGCTACGQVCPTGAAPRLPLPEKQETRIGLAWVNRSRCLPWAYGVPCIICEEACPVPDKAIELDETESVGADGRAVLLQRPVVVQSRCIGCGVCEFKCPMGGEAAIRVFAPTEVGL